MPGWHAQVSTADAQKASPDKGLTVAARNAGKTEHRQRERPAEQGRAPAEPGEAIDLVVARGCQLTLHDRERGDVHDQVRDQLQHRG